MAAFTCDSPAAIWILVSGKRYAGKDTIANLLAEALRGAGRCVARTSFAMGVKADAAMMYGLDLDRLMNDAPYKEGHRKLLIDHGCAMRAVDEAYWVSRTWDSANVSLIMQNLATTQYRPIVIVSDWRFPNEGDWIARRTSVIRVRVTADDAIRAGRGWVRNDAVDSDISECSLDGAAMDITIANNGGADRELVTPIMERIASL